MSQKLTKLRRPKTIPELFDMVADGFLIYGIERCRFEAAWSADLRAAVIVEQEYQKEGIVEQTAQKISDDVRKHSPEMFKHMKTPDTLKDWIVKEARHIYRLRQKEHFKDKLKDPSCPDRIDY